MTGTSLDGLDIAAVETDGHVATPVGGDMVVFSRADRETLASAVRSALNWQFNGPEPNNFAEAEEVLHRLSVEAVLRLARKLGREPDVIGFHGQTVLHCPPALGQAGRTRQLADGPRLAAAVNCPVVYDFRADDMAAGGHGAPLAPVYHAARLVRSDLALPAAVLNIGGVANISMVRQWPLTGRAAKDALIGFDTGPGNGLMDQWAERHLGLPFDADGRLAASGAVNAPALAHCLTHPFFEAPYPKSLDRYAFDVKAVDALSPEDGAATLLAFTTQTIALAVERFGGDLRSIIIAGGGARNPVLIRALRQRLNCAVLLAEDLGWSGDLLEAELMAFLAVRSLEGLPITFPSTTGAPHPLTGGRLAPP